MDLRFQSNKRIMVGNMAATRHRGRDQKLKTHKASMRQKEQTGSGESL